MEIFKKILYRFVYPCSLYFTVLCFILMTTAFFISTESFRPALTVRTAAGIFVFCAVLALAGNIFRIRSVNTAVAVMLHYICATAGFVIAFIFMSGYFSNGVSSLYSVLIFSLLYAVVASAALIVHGVRSRSKNTEKTYVRQFR